MEITSIYEMPPYVCNGSRKRSDCIQDTASRVSHHEKAVGSIILASGGFHGVWR